MAQSLRLHHILQWRIAVIAGIVAGVVFLVINILYVSLAHGLNAWGVLRYAASVVLGQRVLPPPATFDAGIIIVGLLVVLVLSIVYALILATLIHRWGLLVGIIGGALFGAAVYFINLYTFTVWFPWFFALNNIPFFMTHVLFGMVAGGVYELLDYGDDEPFFPKQTAGGTRP